MSDAVYPNPTSTALLVIDIQARLLGAMEPESAQRMVRQTALLIATAAEFGWPVVYSEQYPKGLGPTVESLRGPLEACGARRVEKLEFSCFRNAAFASDVMPTLPNHLIVAGMEAHICVLQTVTDLQARGHQIFVPLDAVSSRQADARENGLALMARAGAVVTNAESVVYYALQRAGTERFKRLQPLLK
jgi:nicotinamidase-related amidase